MMLPTRPRRAAPRLERLEERCVLATIVGVTGTFPDTLVRFNSATPGVVTTIGPVTGLAIGQDLVALDFRPLTGELYGMGFGGNTGQMYKINPLTGAATGFGSPFSNSMSGFFFGMDFDPVTDQIRITSETDENLRVDPNTGKLITYDTPLNPANLGLLGIAYDRNFKGSTQTTLYGYNYIDDHLVTIGSPNGSPVSPNSGAHFDIGATGVVASNADLVGFDIDADGRGYINVSVGVSSGLYTPNLATGALTFVGSFGGTIMRDISVAPAVSFSVSGFPDPRTAGVPANVTITALDIFGNVATGYSGSVNITSSDGAAVLPGPVTLTNGTGSFSVTLNTPGVQSITATDTLSSNITGTQISIDVLANTELVGVTTGNQLVRFFSATPGTLTTIGTVTGMTAGQFLVGVDFRPATGELYGMGLNLGTAQLYRINPLTAVATPVGGPFSTTLTGVSFGFDFNPVTDEIRITSDDGENIRVSPLTGAVLGIDTPTTPTNRAVTALAHDRNFKGATQTTLYGYEYIFDQIVTVGSVNGIPNSPNTGLLGFVGSSGFITDIASTDNMGFDIDSAGGAYLNLTSNTQSGLYTANLTTGAIAFNGAFGGGSVFIRDLAAAPATRFVLSGLNAPHVAGASSPFTVTAFNIYGNLATGYGGSLTFSSSDPSAVFPTTGTLTNGVGTFNATFNTLGTQTLTVNDAGNSAITATANNISVVAGTTLVALDSNGNLVHFNSATPSATNFIGRVVGLAPGQSLVAIDFRPQTTELYGLGIAGSTGQIYKINPATAVATAVGSPFTSALTGKHFGFDFNPVADRIRITSDTGENLRVHPDTGALVANDGTLAPLSIYTGIAYNNNFLGATQTSLYAYDFTNNNLALIGSFTGSPNSPNTGIVGAVGPAGVIASSGTAGNVGFDIAGDGIGYLNLVVGGNSGLYTVNLATGELSAVGSFGTGVTITDVTAAPAARFLVNGFPSPVSPGQSATFNVLALDVFGQFVPGYQGTLTFASSDLTATLPPDTALQNGTGSFIATFNTEGTHTLTAIDKFVPIINGSQFGIVVGGPAVSPPPPPPGTFVDKIGVVRSTLDRTAILTLDSTGNGAFDFGDAVFVFGLSSDTFLVGDWTRLGFSSVGVVRPSTAGVAQFSLDSNGNNVFDGNDAVFFYGFNGDTFLVGDWNGDGRSKIGVVRQSADAVPVFSLDVNGDGQFDGSDTVTKFGVNGDRFVIGDWDGSGISKIGVVRQTASGVALWTLDVNGNGIFDSGDSVFFFGQNSDNFVVGDWNGNGRTKIGVVRAMPNGTALFSLDINGDGVFDAADSVFTFGLATDRFLVGRWPTPSFLVAAAGVGDGSSAPALAEGAELRTNVELATAAWAAAGLDRASVTRLQQLDVRVTNLGGAALGMHRGDTIWLDDDAAGHGWSTGTTAESGRMDLFTVLAHEMGHELGLDHTGLESDLMSDALTAGVRKTPTTRNVDALFAAMDSSGR